MAGPGGLSLERGAAYVLIEARVVKVNRVRPGVVVPDVVGEHVEPARENALLSRRNHR